MQFHHGCRPWKKSFGQPLEKSTIPLPPRKIFPAPMISYSSSQHYAVVNYYSKMEFHKCHRTVIKADLSHEKEILETYVTRWTWQKGAKSQECCNLQHHSFKPGVCNRRPADHNPARQAIWCGPCQHSLIFPHQAWKSYSDSLCEKTKFFVWPSYMSEVGYMAHRQKMLHTPALNEASSKTNAVQPISLQVRKSFLILKR